MSTDQRLQLEILGGFLGSGKSTWLRHQLHVGRFTQHHIIINEAAEVPVDHLLLGRANALTVLPGGCACCTGSAQFVEALRLLCDEQDRGRVYDQKHVVLETSGLAEPARIMSLILDDPMLSYRVNLSKTTVVIDGQYGAQQLQDGSLKITQVESATDLIISKIDVSKQREVARLVRTLKQINPGATITGSILGESAPLPEDDGTEICFFASASEDAIPMLPHRLDLGAEPDWSVLSVWLSGLLHARGHDIVRVKGCVATAAGRLLIQSVREMVQNPEVLPPTPEGEASFLVFIGRGLSQVSLASSYSRLKGN